MGILSTVMNGKPTRVYCCAIECDEEYESEIPKIIIQTPVIEHVESFDTVIVEYKID